MLGVLAALLGGGLPATADDEGKSTTVRSEVGRPIQAAVELIKSNQAKEALDKLKEADAVAGRTPYEIYLTERVKGQALAKAGQIAAAAQALEKAADSDAGPAADRLPLLAAAAGQYYTAKDYPKAAALALRYQQDGGTEAGIRVLRLQALFLSGDYAASAKLAAAEIQIQEQAQKKPPEEQIQILAQSYLNVKDSAGYGSALEKLLSYYPKKDYWLALLYTVRSKIAENDSLTLDLARFQNVLGTLRIGAEYENAAQLALQQGYPVEAKRFLDQGYSANLLGQGADASRHRQLREQTNKNLAEDKKLLGSDDAKLAAAKDGNPLFNSGFNYVLHGQGEKGLSLMEAGFKKGGIRHGSEAKLRLGYAYLLAGQREKAIQAFNGVPGRDGAAILARLWVIHLGKTGAN